MSHVANHSRNSSGLFGFLSILFAMIFIVGPFFLPKDQISGMSQLIMTIFGVALLLIGAIVVIITKLYVKTSADAALVRTGMGGKKIIIDGGAVVIPVIHEGRWVPLNTMRLDVDRNGPDALITGDNLRADVSAEFYIRVKKDENSVNSAATSLGEKAIDPESVKELVIQKLISALRTVSSGMPLTELHAKRDEFAEKVKKIVQEDMEPNGLNLESVTISKLDQTDPRTLNPDANVFDAQGVRAITEITAAQRVQRNQLERDADKKVKEQDVERDNFIAEQERQQATVKAEKQADTQKARSEAEQGARAFTAIQEKVAEVAEVEKAQAIEVANVQREQAITVAEVGKARAREVAEVEKIQTVEVANRDREITVANKEKDLAAAQQSKAEAEALAEAARQQVQTVTVVETAERAKKQTIINQQAEAEKKAISENTNADIAAYAVERAATADQAAAEKRAEAIRIGATAAKDAKVLEAAGEQAVQMVPVEVSKAEVGVDRERVSVEAARVEVKEKDLSIQAKFNEVAITKELRMAEIHASEVIGVANAEAVGIAMSHAEMKIFGDPETMAKMTQSFLKGQSIAEIANGFSGSMPGVMNLLAGIANKMGIEIPENTSSGTSTAKETETVSGGNHAS